MGSDLYPTPHRLALLRAVAKGRVFRDVIGDSYISAGRKVNASLREMTAAGWVELGPRLVPSDLAYWQVADAGRAVLDSHPEPQP